MTRWCHNHPLVLLWRGFMEERFSSVGFFCKHELVYHRHDATRDEATQDIFEYIEVFYNRTRRHSTLGYKSPMQFLEDWRMAQHDENLVA